MFVHLALVFQPMHKHALVSSSVTEFEDIPEKYGKLQFSKKFIIK